MSQPVRVILGPQYMPSMWDLGKRVRAARQANEPVIFIHLSAPINSEIVEVAILSDSLYLIGVKGRDNIWLEFAPDDDKGDPSLSGPPKSRLPGSRWVIVGDKLALSSYRALRLPWMLNGVDGATGRITYAGTPLDLIRFFREWDGNLGRHDARLNILVLIFLLCESLRFRSIEDRCARYIWPVGGMPSDPVMRPILSIDGEMLDRVQEWHKLARGQHPDVWTPPAGIADPLFT
jgi:Ribosome inactivating protein